MPTKTVTDGSIFTVWALLIDLNGPTSTETRSTDEPPETDLSSGRNLSGFSDSACWCCRAAQGEQGAWSTVTNRCRIGRDLAVPLCLASMGAAGRSATGLQ